MGLYDAAIGATGLVLILFLPGFLVVRALARRAREPASDLALAVVISLALTVLVGSALGFAGRFTRENLVLALAAVTALAGLAAWMRRRADSPPLRDGPEAEEMARLAELSTDASRRPGGPSQAEEQEARRLAEVLDARRHGR